MCECLLVCEMCGVGMRAKRRRKLFSLQTSVLCKVLQTKHATLAGRRRDFWSEDVQSSSLLISGLCCVSPDKGNLTTFHIVQCVCCNYKCSCEPAHNVKNKKIPIFSDMFKKQKNMCSYSSELFNVVTHLAAWIFRTSRKCFCCLL